MYINQNKHMGRRRTNTRRRRLYEAKMRGKQNKLMEEAKLADPYTLKGMTMLSVAELEAHNKDMEQKRQEKNEKHQQEEKGKEEKLVSDMKTKEEEKGESTWFWRLLGY